MASRRLFLAFLLSVASFAGTLARAQTKPSLGEELRPPEETLEEIAGVYKDMGVLQRRAMPKAGRFLISSYGSLDFSDGPYSMYGLHLNPGYAFTDFFEVYVNFVPFYINNARSIVAKVESLELANGERATILFSKPKMDYGVEFLWAPAYGKDSVGSRRVIRSDTFFKFGSSMVKYEGASGLKFVFGVGKTFFWPKHFGFRIAAMGYYQQTILDGAKGFRFYANAEAGVVGYF
jgi:hypothetical protein